MKFSILVPVYNVEKYLEQCVESLLNQTYKGEYEVILVDDGSTDSSGKICDKYAENYPDKIKVIHKKNQGLVSARQAGIEIACGEYSLFVDSDDFVENTLLETVSDITAKNNETDVVIFTMNYYNGTTKIPKKDIFRQNEAVFMQDNKKEIYDALIRTPLITSLCLKAIRTSLFKKDPTDYSLYYDKNMAEDWFRSIHLLTIAEKIVYINKHLYNYRTNEESISRSFRPETIEKKNILYVYDLFMEYLPKWDMDTTEYHQRLNARWLEYSMYTFSLYYENVPAKDRKAVLNYNWSSMLPTASQTDTKNPYENTHYRKLFEQLKQKGHLSIQIYFFKKRIYKILRKVKNRLMLGV